MQGSAAVTDVNGQEAGRVGQDKRLYFRNRLPGIHEEVKNGHLIHHFMGGGGLYLGRTGATLIRHVGGGRGGGEVRGREHGAKHTPGIT